ncbi:hypothetical protein ACFL6I_11605 [candidate division KSB1 bacterium]
MITIYKKRNTALNILVILFLISLLFLPLLGYAQETFIPLTEGGIPGVGLGTSFSDFLDAAFKLGLAVAATLAVVMITIGGLQYMTTDSINSKTEGRDKIQNAVVGLLIALLIWLILFTINPNLLKFDIHVGGTTGSDQTAPSAGPQSNQGGGGLSNKPTDYEYEASQSGKTTPQVDYGPSF